MIPSETGSLARDRVSDARPTTSVAAIGAREERLLDAGAAAGSTDSHHSFVVDHLAGRRLARRARASSRRRSRTAPSGRARGTCRSTPMIASVTRWPETDAATSSPTVAPLSSRNSRPTTAGRCSGSVGVVADRNSAPLAAEDRLGRPAARSRTTMRPGDPGGGWKAPRRPESHGGPVESRRDGDQPMSLPVASPSSDGARLDADDVDLPDADHLDRRDGIRNESSTPWRRAGPGNDTRLSSIERERDLDPLAVGRP